jgi:hypothetical protein
MWWAEDIVRCFQVIQDRWCAILMGSCLISGFEGLPKSPANADGDPAANGTGS